MSSTHPWATELPFLRCPSDPGRGLPAFGRTNYAASLGDSPFRGNTGPSNDYVGFQQPTLLTASRAVTARHVRSRSQSSVP